MNTHIQVGAIKPPNQPGFPVAGVYLLEKKTQLISAWGPILEVHPVGQGCAFHSGPMYQNNKKQELLQVRRRALPPLPIWQRSVALRSRLCVGGSFRLPGQRALLKQLFSILPKRMAAGQTEACFGTELAPQHGRTAPEYYVYFCLKNLSYYKIRTTSI